MNQVVLVGRLTDDPEIIELGDGSIRTTITLAVQRDYKNADGEIDADFIKCVLWNNIATAARDYCHKGDLVGIRGKIQNYTYEIEDESDKKKTTKKKISEVVVEKINFISKKHEEA